MARDPLLILHAVRQREVETARRALATYLHADAELRKGIEVLDQTAALDREGTSGIQDGYRFLEIFAARQKIIRTERSTVETDLAALQIRCQEARAHVVAARTAAEAVGQLIDERAVIKRADDAKRDQHALDDITRSRRSARPDRTATPDN